MEYHDDPLAREQLIVKYILRKLPAENLESFESHLLECQECLEEIEVTQFMMLGLDQATVRRRMLDDVAVLEFNGPSRLVRHSRALIDLYRTMMQAEDTKVLIDLSQVSRIDSAGLGMLLTCYSHALRNRGMLKLLRPNAEIGTLLRTTRTDTLLESYQDETQALRSFF